MSVLTVILAGFGIALASYSTAKAPRLTSAILWSLTATIFSAAALLLTAPGPFSEKALWMTLAVPILWTGFLFWSYWDGQPWRVAGGLVSITVVGLATIFLSGPID